VAAAALSTKHALTAAALAPFVPPLAQLQHMAVLALQKPLQCHWADCPQPLSSSSSATTKTLLILAIWLLLALVLWWFGWIENSVSSGLVLPPNATIALTFVGGHRADYTTMKLTSWNESWSGRTLPLHDAGCCELSTTVQRVTTVRCLFESHIDCNDTATKNSSSSRSCPTDPVMFPHTRIYKHSTTNIACQLLYCAIGTAVVVLAAAAVPIFNSTTATTALATRGASVFESASKRVPNVRLQVGCIGARVYMY
jgi:hypothetical protein